MQTDLFNEPVKPLNKNGKVRGQRAGVAAYARLIKFNGEKPGHKCRDCKFLEWRSQSKTWCKCLKADCGTKGPSTDWVNYWKACGLFEPDEPKPVKAATEINKDPETMIKHISK